MRGQSQVGWDTAHGHVSCGTGKVTLRKQKNMDTLFLRSKEYWEVTSEVSINLTVNLATFPGKQTSLLSRLGSQLFREVTRIQSYEM